MGLEVKVGEPADDNSEPAVHHGSFQFQVQALVQFILDQIFQAGSSFEMGPNWNNFKIGTRLSLSSEFKVVNDQCCSVLAPIGVLGFGPVGPPLLMGRPGEKYK